VIKYLLDFIFPPLCLSCKERCLTKFLCPDCWQLCALPDPTTRCRHCFEELDQRGNLCSQCRTKKLLPVARGRVFDPASPSYYLGRDAVDALAGFAIYQWIQLEWPTPDTVIPMPDSHSLTIGRAFAQILDVPLARALSLDCSYKEDRLEEDQELLLFDVDNSLEKLEKGAFSLSESFPKRIYLLTL